MAKYDDAALHICVHRYCGLVIACTVPTNISAPVCRNRTTAPVTVDDTAPQVTVVLLKADTSPSPLFYVAITCRDAESGIESLTLSLHTGDGQTGVLPLITTMTNASEARNMTSIVGRVNTTDINGKVAITQARSHTRALIPRPSLSLAPPHRKCWLRPRSPRVSSSLCQCAASTAWDWTLTVTTRTSLSSTRRCAARVRFDSSSSI